MREAWWSRSGAGQLTFADKVRLTRDAVRELLAQRRSGPDPLPASALDEIIPPPTALARATERASEATLAPWLLNHVLRTWVWATLFGHRDGLAHDGELLYLACLLHDLGLAEPFMPAAGDCFAISGARAAFDLLQQEGMPGERASRVAEAVALHLDIRVNLERGVEAHLLNRAAAVDVAGVRLGEFAPELRSRITQRYPRDGFVPQLVPVIREQAARSPNTRIGFLCRRFQLLKRIEKAGLRRW